MSATTQTVTPYLYARGADAAIAFYKKAFGATEKFRMPMPDGKIMHCELQLGNSRLFVTDEFPDHGCKSPQALNGSPVTIHLDLDDVDATFQQAVAAGATVLMPPADMFWGDRFGKVQDPFGHQWSLSTPKEKLTAEQVKARASEAMKEMGSCGQSN